MDLLRPLGSFVFTHQIGARYAHIGVRHSQIVVVRSQAAIGAYLAFTSFFGTRVIVAGTPFNVSPLTGYPIDGSKNLFYIVTMTVSSI